MKKFCFFLVVLLLNACTSTKTHESMGQYIDSTATTAKVKARLLDHLGPKSLAITVKTYKGRSPVRGLC